MASFSALFECYTSRFDEVAPYYEGDYRDPSARARAAERAAAHPRDRAALVDALLQQNERWGLDAATRANIEALRDPDTVAVVTGQQVGLLSGPLYTPYKTLTVLQLAARLAEETGRTVVPVFWLEGEDHDLAEVAGTRLLKHNEVEHLRYAGHTLPEEGNLGSVGRLAFTDDVTRVVNRVDELLPPTDFKDALIDGLRAAYREGVTFLDAFAQFMHTLFAGTGLVLIAPGDDRLKQLAAPLFRQEIEDYATAHAALQQVSTALEAQFHAQVRTKPLNLFLVEEGARYPLDADGDTVRVRGTSRSYTRAELLELLDAHPERFSPNVVLRPLMQDLLLPTAAYVAGPGEISYFAQFKPVYGWAGIPMPVIYPRASVTLVEGKVQKVLDRYGLSVGDLDGDLEPLFKRIVLQEMPVDVEEVFRQASRHLHQAVNDLKPALEEVDRTLVKAAEATRAAFMKEMGKLQGRVVKAEKRNHDEVRAQLEKAQVNLFPAGKLQERSLSALYFINKYGIGLIEALRRELSLDTTQHQVVNL